MIYRYKISSRSEALGGGWRLQLLEDDVEVGGGVFPLSLPDDPQPGIDWWNSISEDSRLHWLTAAGSAIPADAWRAYLLQEAHEDAIEEAESWLSSRPAEPVHTCCEHTSAWPFPVSLQVREQRALACEACRVARHGKPAVPAIEKAL